MSKSKDAPWDADYFKQIIIIIEAVIKSACYSLKDSCLNEPREWLLCVWIRSVELFAWRNGGHGPGHQETLCMFAIEMVQDAHPPCKSVHSAHHVKERALILRVTRFAAPVTWGILSCTSQDCSCECTAGSDPWKITKCRAHTTTLDRHLHSLPPNLAGSCPRSIQGKPPSCFSGTKYKLCLKRQLLALQNYAC